MEKETTFYYTFYTRLGDMTVGCTASSIVMLSLNSNKLYISNTNLPDSVSYTHLTLPTKA